MIRLILGGEKSGKSAVAYGLFRQAPGPGVVLAMGRARDPAFRAQILAHRLERDPLTPVREPGLELPQALEEAARQGRNVLVDSLDFWLFACMEAGQNLSDALVESLGAFGQGPQCVLVSCEVGLGPIAPTAQVRRFARAQGALNQALAAVAGDVRLVVAGVSLHLK